MTRVVKDPDIRREELIDVAEELFLKNGYEETTVSEIVKKARVAQGTFYYYFESKDDILDAITDRYMHDAADMLGEQVQREGINALEKLINIFKGYALFSSTRKRLVDYIHDERNALLHLKMERKSHDVIVPLFAKIVEEGVTEGLFNTEYPYETALLMAGCWDTLFDTEHIFTKSAEEKKRSIKSGFYVMERILGVNPGSLAEPFLNMAALYLDTQDQQS
jgi:AcrR family transcriptional regulator